jgi:DNA-binding GntR family transcriptional regulator
MQISGKRMLIEEAHQKIKNMIFDQRLAPGQKLIYGDLSRSFNMSPTPVINALHRLEHEGFVVSVPFKGFYVKKIGLQEAWDLFGIREALETYMVEQVILVSEPGEMRQLEEKLAAHASYQPKVYDRKRFMLDSEFHKQLASMSRNQVLVQQLATTLEHFYMRFRFDVLPMGRLRSSADEHGQIIEKIVRKDINGAREAMRNHVQNARNHIIQALSDDQRPEQISTG